MTDEMKKYTWFARFARYWANCGEWGVFSHQQTILLRAETRRTFYMTKNSS